jgi:CheY-like chemotaxis protein
MEPQKTILCIDDEEAQSTLRKLVLESAGYRVLVAMSGREGIRLFQSDSVDAVILDYWMADMKGLAVARELKRARPDVPIIILSAYTPLLDETIGLADLWVRKGEEDPEYLLAKLRELLQTPRGKTHSTVS